MDSNPYTSYYVNQCGSGIVAYQGVRQQKGFGFFSKIFSSTILPALKYFGKKGLSTAANVVEDTIDGRDIKESIKDRGLSTLKEVGREATKKARDYSQRGGKRKVKGVVNKRPKKRVKHDVLKI